MDEQQQPIVILDEQGNEHEFPAGTNPKEAAASIKARLAGTHAPGIENRRDANILGIDHNAILRKIADLATKHLPASIAPAAATLGTAAVDVPLTIAEAFSAPETVAGAGLGGPKSVPNLRTERPAGNILSGIRGMGSEIRKAPGSGVTGKIAGKMMESLPETKTFNDLPLSKQMEHLPTTGAPEGGRIINPNANRSVPPTPPANDLPLWKQQQMMEQAGESPVPLSGGRAQTPPHVPSAAPPVTPDVSSLPRLAGKAPTVEESITQALQDIMKGGEKPTIMSGAPPVETAGGGAFKQSGKFGKSGNLGQAGGYSSGRPPEQTAPVVSTPTTAPGGSPQGPPPDVAPPTSSPLSEMRQPPEPGLEGAADIIRPDTLDSAVSEARMGELLNKMGGKSGDAEMARALRDKLGSREAARKMFGSSSQENIDKIMKLAPGESKIPSDAVDRMRDSIGRGDDWGG